MESVSSQKHCQWEAMTCLIDRIAPIISAKKRRHDQESKRSYLSELLSNSEKYPPAAPSLPMEAPLELPLIQLGRGAPKHFLCNPGGRRRDQKPKSFQQNKI